MIHFERLVCNVGNCDNPKEGYIIAFYGTKAGIQVWGELNNQGFDLNVGKFKAIGDWEDKKIHQYCYSMCNDMVWQQ